MSKQNDEFREIREHFKGLWSMLIIIGFVIVIIIYFV